MVKAAFLAAIIVVLSGPAGNAAEPWEAMLTTALPGKFPEPRAVNAAYRFGWNGISAGTGEATFAKTGGRFELQGSGHTIGFVQKLWDFNVSHAATTDATSLRPLAMKQTDETRTKKIVTELAFDEAGVARKRTETPTPKKPSKPRRFAQANLFDLQSAFLYLRSQTLAEREVHRIVVYPETAAYFATVTVVGREKISVPAGSYNTIELDLQLNKVGKNRALEPHRKFRRATVWLSDDADRLIVRIEAQIFIGTVFAELQSAQFTGAKPTPKS